MLVSPRVLSRRARPWGCLGGRPEAASPPVYAKRALRQQVVIPASVSASATWSLAGPQRKPGRGGGVSPQEPCTPDSVCAEGNPVPPSGKKERGLSPPDSPLPGLDHGPRGDAAVLPGRGLACSHARPSRRGGRAPGPGGHLSRHRVQRLPGPPQEQNPRPPPTPGVRAAGLAPQARGTAGILRNLQFSYRVRVTAR